VRRVVYDRTHEDAAYGGLVHRIPLRRRLQVFTMPMCLPDIRALGEFLSSSHFHQ